MKKTYAIKLVIIVVVVVGGYALLHKSPKTITKSTTASSSASAVNNAVLTTKTSASLGQYLTGPSGKALYTYGADTSGISNCTGACLAAWPAYVDTGSTTGLPTGVSTIKRTDNGQAQYTYNGKPLYYFASDSAGQVTGNGVDSFSVATPVAAATSTPASSSSSSTSSPSSNY